MKFTRRLLIFSYGLFTIAAQTLLFREFITTFEGNDISVGLFFASWFLWVGLGAVLIYRAKNFAEKLLKNIELLFLAYLPAFALQLILIIQAREIAGIESFALLPIRTILLLSIVVNAPVSIITGILFPLACRWVRQDQKLPVSSVYITEAAGSFLGGLGVTVLLALGAGLIKIFFILAFIISLSVFCVSLVKTPAQTIPLQVPKKRMRLPYAVTVLSFVLTFSFLICLAFGVDKPLMRYVRTVKWTKLLPADALIGSFQTAQAEYLYGTYQGQWVAVRQGSVVEALPDKSTYARIAALNLCQNPDAKRILVIGSGLGLCHQLLLLPQIDSITWAHCDGQYVQKLNKFLPPELKIVDRRLHQFTGDVRSLLAENKQLFDLVIINLPDATSSILNRFYTLEFYRHIKDSLTPNGVLGIRIPGGENIMGTELINLGASTKMTLEKVFARTVLTPGKDTWFIASDSETLSAEPGILKDRFASIKKGSDVFLPDALLSVYLPDRAAAALKSYSSADLPEKLLVNRDSRPLVHLYSLLLAAKQSDAPSAKFVKHLALAGPLVFIIPVVVLVLLRITYILKTPPQGGKSGFDSTFLVFSAGLVAIGIVIVLMYLYQTYFGSLYLYIGIISSLFMVGLTTGAALISTLLNRTAEHESRPHKETLLFVVIFVHILVLSAIVFWLTEQAAAFPGTIESILQPTHLLFAVTFVLCGICAGCYFPLAAAQLADFNFETGKAGSKLETADHLGAAAGGLLTSLILVPVLGAKLTLLIFILFLLVNIPPAALRILKRQGCFLLTSPFRLRRLGYVLFGVGLSVVLCSNFLAGAAAKLSPSLPANAAQALAGQSQIKHTSAAIGESARNVGYFKVYSDSNQLSGYIFSSEDFAPEVRGFAGAFNLAVYVDTAGKLLDFHIIRSNETPSYLQLLTQWYRTLKDRQLFSPHPFADVHAVTGATVSSQAVLSALRLSGQRFSTQILGRTQVHVSKKSYWANYLPDITAIYLISTVALTLLVIYYGGFWSRLVVLCFNLIAGGFIFNVQYSSEQIMNVLSLHTPSAGLSAAPLLVFGVPLLLIFFGNVYCGYICPFGAAQELLSFALPEKFKQIPSTEKMQMARFIKYVILFIFVIVFFLSRNKTTLEADPLIKFFNFQSSVFNPQSAVFIIAMAALICSIFYTRFWCRYLCPVGAFLSLFNNIALLKRYTPAKIFGRCEFGLTAKDQMDCLYCDRCRYITKAALKPETSQIHPPTPLKLLSRYFVIAVLVFAVFISSISISFLLQAFPPVTPAFSVSVGGRPRDLDLQKIQTMIQQKKLSDREADFYKKID